MRNHRGRPIRTKRNTTLFVWIGLMLVVACVVVCAAGFAVWAVLGYNPPIRVGGGPDAAASPTATVRVLELPPTPEILSATATPAPPTPEPPTATPVPPPPTDTPVPAPTAATAAPGKAQAPEPAEAPAQPAAPSSAVAGAATQKSKGLRMGSPEYGMQAFLWWRAETADRDLKLIQEAGFTWVKQIFGWRDIEGAGKNQFDWERPDRIIGQVEQYGLDLIARVDNQPGWAGGGFPGIGPPDNPQDFADFLFAFASRYKGRVRAYQIWNEPNLAREWGEKPPNPAEYTAMLKITHEAIKRADPNAMIISAGMAPTSRFDNVAMPDVDFIRGMYAAGAKPYFDVLGAHGAGYAVAPETDPNVVATDAVLSNGDPSPPERRRIYCFRHVEDLRQVMVENGDEGKQVALLEFGWTSDKRADSPYHWHAVTEDEKADYFVRAYKYASQNWSPWIGVMSLIYMPYPEWTEDDEKWWWSIIVPKYPDLWALPAYGKLKEMPK